MLDFGRISFRIDHDGDLEIIIDTGDNDQYAYLKPDEVQQLRDYLNQQVTHD